MIRNERTYQLIRWMTQLFFPTLGALFFCVDIVIGFKYGQIGLGLITLFDMFLGIYTEVSTMLYKHQTRGGDDERV